MNIDNYIKKNNLEIIKWADGILSDYRDYSKERDNISWMVGDKRIYMVNLSTDELFSVLYESSIFQGFLLSDKLELVKIFTLEINMRTRFGLIGKP